MKKESALAVLSAERARFAVIATLLAVCALVQECNDIVATSGLVSQAGASNLLRAWTLDALLAASGSCLFALRVDRTDRVMLAARLLIGFGLSYGLLYGLLLVHAPGWARYGGLLLLNNQQAYLAVVLIWTLAKDVFTVGQATRLFGLLGSATLGGSLLGNLLATTTGRWQPHWIPLLLLLNGVLTLGCAGLVIRSRRLLTAPRQPVEAESWTDGFVGSLRYVWRERPLRYLALSTITTGAVWTVMTYHLLTRLTEMTHGAQAPGTLQTAYGLFTFARPIMQAMIQAMLAGWLIGRIGFRRIFLLTPLTLLIGLGLMACLPGIVPIAIGLYLLYAIFGVEEPAGHAFLALAPAELRGRVSALIEGCCAPAGYIVGCALVLLAQNFAARLPLVRGEAPAFSLTLAVCSAALGLWAGCQLSRHARNSSYEQEGNRTGLLERTDVEGKAEFLPTCNMRVGLDRVL